jgi:hypothetical protein
VETAPPLVNLRGEAVALGPFPPDRADAVARWYNDYAVMRNWEFLPGPRTAAALRPPSNRGASSTRQRTRSSPSTRRRPGSWWA